jgi:hypothetical protein
VGDQVLLRTKGRVDGADMGKLGLLWDGPFRFIPTACPSPNAYTLALQRTMLVQPDGHRGPAVALPHAGRRPYGSGPPLYPGQEGEREVELRLLGTRRSLRGVQLYQPSCSTSRGGAAIWRRTTRLGGRRTQSRPIARTLSWSEYDAAAPRRRGARRNAGAATLPAGAGAPRWPRPGSSSGWAESRSAHWQA